MRFMRFLFYFIFYIYYLLHLLHNTVYLQKLRKIDNKTSVFLIYKRNIQ